MIAAAPRFGLILPNRGVVIGATTVGEMLELGELADAGPWESLWVGDSLLAKPRLDAITLLSALAARTKRVRLGVSCMASTPIRDPLLLAYQWSSLDHLSGGRTVFVACQGGGPGSGDFAHELETFGVERDSRMQRMEEAVEILRLTSSAEHVSYEGRYTRFRDVTIAPRPVQRPLPIWIAANPDMTRPRNVEKAYRRVARLGDGWQTTHTPPDDVRRSLALIETYAAEIGRALTSSFEVSVCSNICVNDDRDAAFAEAKRFLDLHSDADYTPDFLATWVAVGSAADCRAYLRRFIDVGATTILLRLSSFDQRRQFEVVTEKVIAPLLALGRPRPASVL
ncbi:MAG TPA: LLM class flavin-dependent oxidoreductase [Candidatus Limnocylindria bacterium]|nr:LLM class flavin-dependent oxidoreductase [Candidatus Limnocylindria bacterium]